MHSYSLSILKIFTVLRQSKWAYQMDYHLQSMNVSNKMVFPLLILIMNTGSILIQMYRLDQSSELMGLSKNFMTTMVKCKQLDSMTAKEIVLMAIISSHILITYQK